MLRLEVSTISGELHFDTDIEEGVNWAIANRATYNVVAVNLSLGDSSVPHTAHCETSNLAAVLGEALAAGIQPVVSSGNSGSSMNVFTDGIADPACAPAAVSVGAVYDQSFGTLNWEDQNMDPVCTDASAADKVVCWSQTAPILSFLAPGVVITAAGVSAFGTSQAAPHVAGAWAVASAQTPGARPTLEFQQHIGEPVSDSRPSGGRTTPRIDLLPEPGSTSLLVAGALGVASLARRRRH